MVSEPKDVSAIERTGAFHGLYHVLGGVISPMAKIGPEQLHVRELPMIWRITKGSHIKMGVSAHGAIQERIMAMGKMITSLLMSEPLVMRQIIGNSSCGRSRPS